MGTTYPYTLDIPDANNNPSVDQPNLKINTNSIKNLINVDHISLGLDNGGIHRQVRMRNQGAPGLGDGQGALYCDNVNSDGNAWPIWQNSLGQYQIISQPASFPIAPFTNGVIPMAGKMIMQFGVFATTTNGSGNANTVGLNVSFPNYVFNVQAIPQLSTFTSNQVYGATKNGANTGSFLLYTSSNIPVGTNFFWIAIGG